MSLNALGVWEVRDAGRDAPPLEGTRGPNEHRKRDGWSEKMIKKTLII